jgi:hypothetical protein
VNKSTPTLSHRLTTCLAALRTARTRLYNSVGHKHLEDSPDFSAELHATFKRIDDECARLAHLKHKVMKRRNELEVP